MTLTSWQFGIFVAIVFGAYYLPPLRTFQIQFLVVASLVFYGYGQPELLPLLAAAVFGTYLFLLLALRNRPIWLPVGITFNLALLAFFKYKFLIVEPSSQASSFTSYSFRSWFRGRSRAPKCLCRKSSRNIFPTFHSLRL